MSGAPLLRLKQVFLQVSELPVDRRAAFLDAQPDLTAAMRARVSNWLARADDVPSNIGDLLPSPAVQRFEGPDPTTIGPYRVLRRIGEGGMGVVYLAEQATPVARQVAVKRIKPGMDSAGLLRRFEAERQALERMNHPAIARVLDAGIDDAGRPYVAMEHVDGVSLIEYCDRERLDPEARLRLFLEVCRGVQHAHQKSVLHRDLKPSNVLVASIDGRPFPKIIDFGVAKALERRLTEQTAHTQFGVLIGTPEYMSPEQAEPGAADVDTRSDVYSLGVVLYELLSGELPFSPGRLREAGVGGMQRVLRLETPPRPSTRVSTVGEHTAEHARRRCLPAPMLAQRLRGDLDWITMRALEKRPEQRYGSCGELAADIERHLRDEPVVAGPPTVRYHLQKLLQRYRVQAIAAVLLTVAILLGTGASIWFAVDAHTANQRLARSQRDLLKERRAVESVLDRATRGIEQRSRDGSGPLAEARDRAIVGEAYSALGRHVDAAGHLRRAVQLFQSASDVSASETYELMRSALLDQTALGSFGEREGWLERYRWAAGRVLCDGEPRLESATQALGEIESPQIGRGAFDRVFEVAGQCLEPGDPRWTALADVLTLHLGFAIDRIEIGKRVLAIYQRQGLNATDPGWLRARLVLAQHCNNPAQGKHVIACQLARDALVDVEAELPNGHWFAGVMRFQLGYGYLHLGQWTEAIRELRAAQQVFDSELGDTGAWAIGTAYWLSECCVRQGQHTAANRLHAELAQRVRRSRIPAHLPLVKGILGSEFALLAGDLAKLYECRRDPGVALPLVADIVSRCRTCFPDHGDVAAAVAKFLALIGNDLSNAGAHSAPMRRLFEYVDDVMCATAAGRTYDVFWLARHCMLLGDHAAGERVVTAALRGPLAITDPAEAANLHAILGLCRGELGGGDAAFDLAFDGYLGLVETLGFTNGNTNDVFGRLLGLLRRNGHGTRARQMARDRLQQLEQRDGDSQSLWMLGLAAIARVGDDVLAASVVEQMQRRFSGDFRTWCLSAHLAALRFDHEMALAHADRAIAIAPESWLCQAWTARVHGRLGMADEALACARRAAQLRNNAEERHDLAERLFRLGRLDDSRAHFERLSSEYPDYAPGPAGLSACRRASGDAAGALAAAQRAFELAPPAGRAELARARLANGQPATSLFVAHAAAAGRPNGDGFWSDYAVNLARAGRFAEARQRLEQLTIEWPTEPHAWAVRAWVLATTAEATDTDRQAALAAARRAVELSGRRGPVMLASLAEACFRSGDREGAWTAIDECRRAMRGRNAEWLTLAEVEARRRRYGSR